MSFTVPKFNEEENTSMIDVEEEATAAPPKDTKKRTVPSFQQLFARNFVEFKKSPDMRFEYCKECKRIYPHEMLGPMNISLCAASELKYGKGARPIKLCPKAKQCESGDTDTRRPQQKKQRKK